MSLPARPSRRGVLAAVAATALPFGGATRAAAPASSLPDWPQYRFDPAGTGYAPDATGPGDDVRVRWRHDRDGGLATPSSPVLADGTLYWAPGGLVALDARDGSRAFRLDGWYHATPAVTGVAAYRTPTLVSADREGAVGLAADGGLALLDRRFGDERWRADTDRDGRRLHSPAGPEDVHPPAVADGTAYVAVAGGLVAVAPSSGRVRWSVPDVRARPAVRDGTVYAVRYPATALALDAGDGSQQWQRTVEETLVSAPAVADGTVYVPDRNGVTALAADDGDRQWRAGFDGEHQEGAPAVADGTVYVSTDGTDGALHALDAASGDTEWTAPYGTGPDAGGPVVAGDTVYVAGDDGLHALDAGTGDHRWSFEPEFGGASSPVVAGGLAFTAGHAALYALEGVDDG